jgi:hypothetical protein
MRPCTGWVPDEPCTCEPEPSEGQIDAAALILDALTGERFGLCTVTVRPCVERKCQRASCACCHLEEIWLPGPVDSITEVLIDGVELDYESYHVDDHRWLVRDDDDTWPVCPTPFTVTYLKGIPVPAGGQAMVADLACELAKAACDDKTCRLPRRITGLSRQGVSITFEHFAGLTGLFEVDSWVDAVNRLGMTPRVSSVDLPRVREQTWPVS